MRIRFSPLKFVPSGSVYDCARASLTWPPMSGLVTRQIRVSGRVQGVGFRAGLRDEARGRGVRGWVRNRADGTVEALLRGAPAQVDAVIAWARRGPPGARVSALRISDAPPGESGESFELRPTL
jgi:acylphosphatase